MKTRKQLEDRATKAINEREGIVYQVAAAHKVAPSRIHEGWFHAEVMLHIARTSKEYGHLKEEVYA